MGRRSLVRTNTSLSSDQLRGEILSESMPGKGFGQLGRARPLPGAEVCKTREPAGHDRLHPPWGQGVVRWDQEPAVIG